MSISYAPNERVLCYHGPLIYEAKVLKAENWDENTTKLGSIGPHYYVHYKGWKQTWVPTRTPILFSDSLTRDKISM
jgi:mortality factor 4-like protein 1